MKKKFFKFHHFVIIHYVIVTSPFGGQPIRSHLTGEEKCLDVSESTQFVSFDIVWGNFFKVLGKKIIADFPLVFGLVYEIS